MNRKGLIGTAKIYLITLSILAIFTIIFVLPASAADTTLPQWSNIGSSTTTPTQNSAVTLFGMAQDDVAMDWAVLSTNETGVWANITWYDPLHLNSYTKWYTVSGTLDNSVYVEDLDGDGKPEILTLGEYYNFTDDSIYAQLRIWSYTATSTTSGTLDVIAEKDWTNNSEAYGYSVVVDDLNHDGHKKIITCGATGGVWNNGDLRIWNYTNGVINLEAINDWYMVNVTNITSAWSLTTSDINGDGHDEIVTAGMFNESYNPVYISQLRVWNYTNNAINLIANTEWYTGGRTEAQSVRVGDLAGDGTKKIVVGGLSMGGARYQAEVSIFNLTNNVLMLEDRTDWHGLNDTIVYSLDIGDVNNDGVPELVTGGLEKDFYDDINYTRRAAQLRIWNYTNRQLSLKDDVTWYVPYGGDSEIYSLAINDINKDGIPEIVTAGLSNNEYGPGNIDRGQVRIWTYLDNVTSLLKSIEWSDCDGGVLQGELDDSLKIADLNGDGINEIITGGRIEKATKPYQGILAVYSAGNRYGSPMNMTKIAGPLWSNFTWQNTSVTAGTVVGWRIYYNDTSGNQNATPIQTFTVTANINKPNSSCTLSFSPVSPINYETPETVTCVCDNPENPTVKLWRNGIDITSENNTPVTLGANSYTYVCNSTETQNMSTGSSSADFVVNRGTPLLYLISNVTGWNTTFSNAVNVIGYNCPTNGASDVNCSLYRNTSTTNPVSGPSQETIQENILLGLGAHLYVYNTSDGQNWTSYSNSSILIITLENGQSCNSSSECSSGYCVNNICKNTSTYCGDSVCDSGETCGTCPSDCGTCPSSGGGGTSVGGGFVFSGAALCTENWNCTNWSLCIEGIQTRTCTDKNKCGTTKSKPSLSQSCLSTICTEDWSCTDWSACINNTQTRTCTDNNKCGTTSNKPTESQNCTTGPTVATESIAPTGLFLGLTSIEWIIAIIVGIAGASAIILISTRREKKKTHKD